jgi:hypothetical protein
MRPSGNGTFGAIDLHGRSRYSGNDPDFAAGPEGRGGRFGNRRMTYYGRWTYKFESGRRGSIAALIVTRTRPRAMAGRCVVLARRNYALARAPPTSCLPHVCFRAGCGRRRGTSVRARRARWRNSARWRAVGLGLSSWRRHLSADLSAQVEHIEAGMCCCASSRPDETIMVAAHWDAYGQGEPDAQGRTVRAGANDDALGTAGVLELARVLKAEAPLERSVVFAVWTAEESGLLGSEAYANAPVYPLERTVANLTLDILQTAGPARDVILVGEGQSELQDDLERAAARQGRVVTPENLPENGLFYRADHFSPGPPRRCGAADHGHCRRRRGDERPRRRASGSPTTPAPAIPDLRPLEPGLGPARRGAGHRVVPRSSVISPTRTAGRSGKTARVQVRSGDKRRHALNGKQAPSAAGGRQTRSVAARGGSSRGV